MCSDWLTDRLPCVFTFVSKILCARSAFLSSDRIVPHEKYLLQLEVSRPALFGHVF